MRLAADIALDLRKEMAAKGFSQLSLAIAVQVDQSQISRFRRGRFAQRSPNLVKVCQYLGVQVEAEATSAQSLKDLEITKILDRVRNASGIKKRAALRLLRALNELLD